MSFCALEWRLPGYKIDAEYTLSKIRQAVRNLDMLANESIEDSRWQPQTAPL